MSNTRLGLQLWLMYTRSQFSSMCSVREACTEEYATVAGLGLVMRAKMECAGRETREREREVKAPGLRSTWRRRVRSGLTQAGISLEGEGGMTVVGVEVELGLVEDGGALPLEVGGAGEGMAVGDMVVSGTVGMLLVVSSK